MEKVLKRWLKLGLLTEDKYKELLAENREYKRNKLNKNIQITMYTIGAILLGLGIILFIANNNWLLDIFKYIGKLISLSSMFIFDILKNIFSSYWVKIVSLVFITFGCFYFGYNIEYQQSSYPRLGSCLIFLSTLLMGGTYFLIGNIYNINSDSILLYIMWFISIFPLAFVFKSKPINILSSIIFIIFSCIGGYDLYKSEYIMLFLLAIVFYNFANIPVIYNKYRKFSKDYKTFAIILMFLLLLIHCIHLYINMDIIKTVNIYTTIWFLVIWTILNFGYREKNTLIIKLESIYISILLIYLPLLIPLNYDLRLVSHILIIYLIGILYYYGNKIEDKIIVSQATICTILYIIINYINFMEKYLAGATYFILFGMLLVGGGYYIERKIKRNK